MASKKMPPDHASNTRFANTPAFLFNNTSLITAFADGEHLYIIPEDTSMASQKIIRLDSPILLCILRSLQELDDSLPI